MIIDKLIDEACAEALEESGHNRRVVAITASPMHAGEYWIDLANENLVNSLTQRIISCYQKQA